MAKKTASPTTPKTTTKSSEKSSAKKSSSEVLDRLDNILEMEVSGIARYLHYSFMIRGANRIPIVKFFRDQATEGFNHAAIIGEKISSLGGHPSVSVNPVPESNKHGVLDILKESLEFERKGLQMYVDLLPHVGNDVALEELVREFIRTETEHIEEVEKMVTQ